MENTTDMESARVSAEISALKDEIRIRQGYVVALESILAVSGEKGVNGLVSEQSPVFEGRQD